MGSFHSNPHTLPDLLGSRRGRVAGDLPEESDEEAFKLPPWTSQGSYPWQRSSDDRGPHRAEVNGMGKTLRYFLFILRTIIGLTLIR